MIATGSGGAVVGTGQRSADIFFPAFKLLEAQEGCRCTLTLATEGLPVALYRGSGRSEEPEGQ